MTTGMGSMDVGADASSLTQEISSRELDGVTQSSQQSVAAILDDPAIREELLKDESFLKMEGGILTINNDFNHLIDESNEDYRYYHLLQHYLDHLSNMDGLFQDGYPQVHSQWKDFYHSFVGINNITVVNVWNATRETISKNGSSQE